MKKYAFFCLVLAGLQANAWAAYADKSIHDAGDEPTYKHPNQKSYTSPFDYAPHSEPKAAPVREPEAPPAGRCNQFTFDATKSYDIDRQKLSVLWDFGDGQTSDKPVVTHVYEKAGDYLVNLTVKDSSGLPCDTSAATTKVTANYPPMAQAGEDVRACTDENAAFDASASSASGPATYRWNFGDGETAEGAKVSHAYAKPGNYKVSVTVDDGKGTECSVAQDWLTAQIAGRTTVQLRGPESACVGRNVGFEAVGTGGAKYRWDFGDGTVWEGGSKASHTYEKGGNYTVTVTADNGQGFPCSVASSSASVKVNAPPVADAGENLACCTDKEVTFDGSGSSDPDGDTLRYHWDFGDGTTSEDAKTSHTYTKSGQYRVVLTVSDGSDCGTATDSFVADVNTQPQAVIEVR